MPEWVRCDCCHHLIPPSQPRHWRYDCIEFERYALCDDCLAMYRQAVASVLEAEQCD